MRAVFKRTWLCLGVWVYVGAFGQEDSRQEGWQKCLSYAQWIAPTSSSVTIEVLDGTYRERAREIAAIAQDLPASASAQQAALLEALQFARLGGPLTRPEETRFAELVSRVRADAALALEQRYEVALRYELRLFDLSAGNGRKERTHAMQQLYKKLIREFPALAAPYESLINFSQALGPKKATEVADYLQSLPTLPIELKPMLTLIRARKALLGKKLKAVISPEAEDGFDKKVLRSRPTVVYFGSGVSDAAIQYKAVAALFDSNEVNILGVTFGEKTSDPELAEIPEGTKFKLKPGRGGALIEKLGLLGSPMILAADDKMEIVYVGPLWGKELLNGSEE